jgi:hypothetical protein
MNPTPQPTPQTPTLLPGVPTTGPTPALTGVTTDLDRLIEETAAELAAQMATEHADRRGVVADAIPAKPGQTPPPGYEREGDSFVRSLVVGTGATLGGIAGGTLGAGAGGIGAIPGAMVGAGTMTVAADQLMDLVEQTRRTPAEALIRAGEQGVTGGLLEGIGHGLHRPLAAAARRMGLHRMLTPEQQSLRAAAKSLDIPLRAGDMTESRALQQLERVPTYFPFGAAPVQRFGQRQITAADRATQAAISQFGKRVGSLMEGVRVRADIDASLKGFRFETDNLFKQVELAIGPEPVVPTARLRAAVEALTAVGEKTPLGTPRGVGRLADVVGGGNVSVGGVSMPVSALPTDIQKALLADKIPFSLARAIESQLRQLGKSPAAIGTITQGQYGGLRNAVARDIDEFLLAPTTPGHHKQMLDQAKQVWRVGKSIYNESILAKIRDPKFPPEKILDRVFGSGPTAILDLKQVVSGGDTFADPGRWPMIQGAFLGSLYDRAVMEVSPGVKAFSPSKFVTAIEPFIKDGRLGIILDPESERRMLTLVDVLRKTTRGEQAAGGNVSGALLATGQVEDIVQSVFRLGRAAALGSAAYLAGGAKTAGLALGACVGPL